LSHFKNILKYDKSEKLNISFKSKSIKGFINGMTLGMKAIYSYIPSAMHDLFQFDYAQKKLPFHIIADRKTLKVKIFAGEFSKNRSIYDVNGEDVFVDKEPLLIWRPTSRTENGVPTAGSWIEISVLGNAYLVDSRKKFPRDLEWNVLEHYSIIYCKGALLLWRCEGNNLEDSSITNMYSKTLICPITLEPLPTGTIKKKASVTCIPWFWSECG
jgi:hypothetical protein